MFDTGQSLEQQQELLELETENERLLMNILPRHVVPFFTASRHHGQVSASCLLTELCASCLKTCMLAHVIAEWITGML